MRSRTLGLFAAGILAFLISLIAWLPATVLAYWLPASVSVGTLTGTIWNGGTDVIAIDNRALGALQWKVRPLSLLRGRLAAEATLSSGTRSVTGRFSVDRSRRIEAQNVQASVPLASLPLRALPAGWTGDLQASLRRFSFERNAIRDLVGTIDLRNLQQPPPDALAIGSYRLTFDEESRQGDQLRGQLQDLGGPMQVRGTVTLSANRELAVAAQVTPRPDAPKVLLDSLQFLGSPGPQGARPFSITATY